MTLEEDLVKKKLKRMKEKFPEMDVDQIEKELYPLQGEEVTPKVGKKKRPSS